MSEMDLSVRVRSQPVGALKEQKQRLSQAANCGYCHHSFQETLKMEEFDV